MFSFITAKIWGYVAAFGAIIAAIVTFGATKKRQGRKDEKKRQEDADNEKAATIRERVHNVKRVSDDDIKYRDN